MGAGGAASAAAREKTPQDLNPELIYATTPPGEAYPLRIPRPPQTSSGRASLRASSDSVIHSDLNAVSERP